MRTQCPECDSWISVPRSIELWDTFSCPKCHTELQLVNDDPVEVDYADSEDVLAYEGESDDGYEDYDDD